MQSRDSRLPLERTEHQDNPAILFDVRNRLYATTRQIQIGDLRRTENSKRVLAFRRKINVPVSRKRGSRYKEDMLRLQKGSQVVVNS